jgi:hypothetical protein
MIAADSEMEDFNSAIEKAGYARDDFEVSGEDSFPDRGVGPITGTVTVTYKKTGLQCTYKAGHGTAWVFGFENDLKTGAFKK